MSYITKIEKVYNQKINQAILPLYIILVFIVVFSLLFLLLIIYAVIYKLLAYLIAIFLVVSTFYLFIFVAINFFGKKIEKNNNTFGKGTIAEDKVISYLSTLDGRYKTIPSFPKGKGDIDCIVVGPTGIFVIEIKANSGDVYYFKNNIRKVTEYGEKFIKQAAKNSQYLHDLLLKNLGLNCWVYGLVVRPNNDDKHISPFNRNQICILDGKVVVEHIQNAKETRLDIETIDKINDFLWQQKRFKKYK